LFCEIISVANIIPKKIDINFVIVAPVVTICAVSITGITANKEIANLSLRNRNGTIKAIEKNTLFVIRIAKTAKQKHMISNNDFDEFVTVSYFNKSVLSNLSIQNLLVHSYVIFCTSFDRKDFCLPLSLNRELLP